MPMSKELPKAYEPQNYEDAIYKRWEESGFFAPEAHPPRADNPDGSSPTSGRYVNILPPPNANGELHVGHASGYTTMDFLGRYHRMKGEKVLLLPGKDHAGIQTQVVYEKKIKKESGLSRHDLGRNQFYQDAYAFCLDRAQYMRNQEKKIGLSADWSREKFTLDPNLLQVVLGTFSKMFNEVDADGNRMVYRGECIINWCPRCATALSDVELEHEEQTAKLYTFKYSADFPLTIATSRPETKLGDTAVAVNPKDKRFQKYIGQEFVVKKFAGGPDLKIKIIADESIDMTFGTGALGVTPAHSMVDFEMAEKNNLEIVKVINENGTINSGFGPFSNLSVIEARLAVVAALKRDGLLEKEEDYANNLSVCERCRTAIEPLPSKQWFVNLDHSNFSLKQAAHKAIVNGEIKIYPERFTKVMLSWIDNVHDWCISRQIWWGPRIPAWYKRDEIQVGEQSPGEGWVQDEDTFDTWFSSGQWPFITLGYPENDDFKNFYPTDIMETAGEIIFFWVSRMIMLGLYITGKIPFKKVYLHGLVLDAKGQKMSKSKGNVIDPLTLTDKFGTDAFRMGIIIGNTPGTSLALAEDKIKAYKHFANKLWNITRFVLSNTESFLFENKKEIKLEKDDKKIMEELKESLRNMGLDFEHYLSHLKKPEDELKEGFKAQAARRVKIALALQKIGEEEKIEATEEEIKKLVPDAHVLRLDADITKGSAKKARDIIRRFYSLPSAILVGTEMALPYLKRIANAAVISLDSLFAIPDFRMHERIFGMLLALREKATKRLLIQTRVRDSSFFNFVLQGNLSGFYKKELEDRKHFGYPPFTVLIKISWSGTEKAVLVGKKTLEGVLAEWKPNYMPARKTLRGSPSEAARKEKTTGHFGVGAIIRVDTASWPDHNLVHVLASLPPAFEVEVAPEDIL